MAQQPQALKRVKAESKRNVVVVVAVVVTAIVVIVMAKMRNPLTVAQTKVVMTLAKTHQAKRTQRL